MGATKRILEADENKKQVAVEIAVRVGLLERCEFHTDEVFDPLENNNEDAYKLANSLITDKHPLVAIFDGDRRELTDLLNEIQNDFADECTLCAKWKEDD